MPGGGITVRGQREVAILRFKGKEISGFLRKPFRPGDLVAAIRSALRVPV